MQLFIRTKLQQWLSAEDEDGSSALAMARAVDTAIDAACTEELRVWMAKTTWNMAVQSKHHLARYTLLAVAAKCLQADQALQRLNCRVVQLASLLAAATHRGRRVGLNMLKDASVASDDCFGILTDLELEAEDKDIIRRKRIVLIYRVKLAMIEKNAAALNEIIDRCTADPNVDALTMTLVFACINSEEEQGEEAPSPTASSSELHSLRAMSLKGALVKHLQCHKHKTEAVDAPRARTVVRLGRNSIHLNLSRTSC